MTERPARVLDLRGLETLVDELRRRGYEVHGPQVRDGVIAHDRLDSIGDLPVGVTDEQEGGHYRLLPRDDKARFGYAVGPQSWKELLHPSRTKVWTITRRSETASASVSASATTTAVTEAGGDLEVRMHEPDRRRLALFGVRPCELAAIAKQDRVLLGGPHPDPAYQANRADAIIVAVACGDPAATCFCPSMGTGPAVGSGADLSMTELVDGDDVSYVVEAATAIGIDLLESIPSQPATADHQTAAARVVTEAEATIGRRLDTDGVKELIYDNLDSTQWDDLAERCLTCGNCTLACPTCFCTNLEDVTDLSGVNTDRWRVWDTCFSLDFSHLGPGPIRASGGSRYRQWFVHKLASWYDQFDESGCVGCGRCITWCPVGIDLTAEVARMRAEATP